MEFFNEQLSNIINELELKFEKRFNFVRNEFALIRAGRVSTSLVERVVVDYFGEITPIKNLSNISCQDARTIVISPWDIAILKDIVRAVSLANLGVTPIDDGRIIRLNFPPLTESTRKDLVKKVKKLAEEGKVQMRTDRRDALAAIKKVKLEDNLSEDDITAAESEVDKLTNLNTSNLDVLLSAKEKDILTI
ncbi:MAG: ribosome recycling factor [Christensenellaceae bacterium]|jgi:ribosome recycling factor|nr:ribosome recycling factor [Christensenellaceae bacterium]